MLENIFLRRMYKHYDYPRSGGLAIGYNNAAYYTRTLGHRITVTDRGDYAYYGNMLQLACPVPTIDECKQDFADSGWNDSEIELATYIMLKGQADNFYGRHDTETVMAIGEFLDSEIDWSRSRPAENETWSSFAGTFHEAENEQLLATRLVCIDDTDHYQPGRSFGIEMPSIADILRASSGLFLGELDD